MTTSQKFSGLAMPVFTAFGWAGQENAVNYALEQMEQFITSLRLSLSRSAQAEFPFAGLSRKDQTVFLAASKDVESDIHIVFFARPVSLELQLALTDKKALTKGLGLAEKQPATAHRLITELGTDWSLRIQQMQIDEDSGEAVHYQDIFKDDVINFGEDESASIINTASYRNSEEKWVTPIYVSRRFKSEQVSVMGMAVLDVVGQEVEKLLPLVQFLRGKKAATAKKKSKKASRAKKAAVVEPIDESGNADIDPETGFTFVTAVKPLFLRKGFINMTANHWDFFAINSRTETRPVTVYYDGIYDKSSAVWHIQSNGMARLVMSPSVHAWFDDNFDTHDHIHLAVKRLEINEIQVSLKMTA